ncbi:MAG: tetratricopeptide repeat protein [Planctomycetota bacterium]
MTHDDRHMPEGPDDGIGPVTGSEHYQRGVELFEQGRLRDALYHIDRALELMHVDADICLVKGQILFEMKQPDEAVDWLARAGQLNPLSADVQLWKGRAQHLMKRFRAALACFNRVLEVDPRNIDAHVNRGMSLVELGEHDRAREAFAIARDHAGESPDREFEIEYWLARIDRANGDIDAARDRLEKVVSANAGYISAVAELGDLLRSAQRSDADLERAKEVYEAGLLAEPDDPALHNDYGNLLRELSDLKGSLHHLTRAIEENPDHEVAWFNRGLTLEELGRGAEAANDFREAVRIDPTDIDARLKIADNELQTGRFRAALEQIEAVLEVAPGHADAILCAGEVLNRQTLSLEAAGDWRGAADALRMLMELAPDLVNVDEHKLDGIDDNAAGPGFPSSEARHEAAIEAYASLWSLDDTATPFGIMLAVHLVRMQLFSRAALVLDGYTHFAPDDAFAWALRAVCAAETGDPAAAVAHIDRALAIRPSFVELLWEKAGLLESDELDDAEGAIRCYEEILAASNEHRWCHEPLARLYDETGDPVRALGHLRAHEQFLQSVGLRERFEGPLQWALGRIRLALGQPLAAIDHLQRALDAPAPGEQPSIRPDRDALAHALSQRGDDTSEEADVDAGEVRLLLGQAQLALGRLDEARSQFEVVLAEAETLGGVDASLVAELRTALATVAIRQREFAEADELLAAASSAQPRQSREQLLARAHLEFRRSADSRAREYLDRVIIRSPRRDEILLEALLLQARLAWRSGDAFLALEAADEILATDAYHVHAAALKVELMREVGEEREAQQARRDYRMASVFLRAARAVQENRPADALALLTRYRSEAWASRADFLYLRAAAEARMGRHIEACNELARAIALDQTLADEVTAEPSFDALQGDPRFTAALQQATRRDRPMSMRRTASDVPARPAADPNDEPSSPASPSAATTPASGESTTHGDTTDAELLHDAEHGIDWDSLMD